MNDTTSAKPTTAKRWVISLLLLLILLLCASTILVVPVLTNTVFIVGIGDYHFEIGPWQDWYANPYSEGLPKTVMLGTGPGKCASLYQYLPQLGDLPIHYAFYHCEP